MRTRGEGSEERVARGGSRTTWEEVPGHYRHCRIVCGVTQRAGCHGDAWEDANRELAWGGAYSMGGRRGSGVWRP